MCVSVCVCVCVRACMHAFVNPFNCGCFDEYHCTTTDVGCTYHGGRSAILNSRPVITTSKQDLGL